MKLSSRRFKIALALLAVLIIASIVALVIWLNQPSDTSSVRTAKVDKGDVVEVVMTSGILKPAMQVNVGAQVTGQVKKIYVRQGEAVHKGQLLAEIDPTLQINDLKTAQAQLASAKAQKESYEAQLRVYELELKRQRRLERDRAGVQSDLEKVEGQYVSQQQQLKMNAAQIIQAQISVDTAQANVGYTRIVAPIDGVVLGIVTNEGQTVVSSQTSPTIMVLADVNTMRVQTRISETDILKVKPGQPLTFSVVANPAVKYKSVMGEIQSAPVEALQDQGIGGSASSAQQQNAVYYNGEFSVDNAEQRLKTSMTAQVFIESARATNVTRVPRTTLSAESNGKYQVMVLENGQQKQRWITIGVRDRQYAEVIEGLRPGENLVLATDMIGKGR